MALEFGRKHHCVMDSLFNHRNQQVFNEYAHVDAVYITDGFELGVHIWIELGSNILAFKGQDSGSLGGCLWGGGCAVGADQFGQLASFRFGEKGSQSLAKRIARIFCLPACQVADRRLPAHTDRGDLGLT